MDNEKRTDEERKAAKRLIFLSQRLAELRNEVAQIKAEREILRKQRGARPAGAKKAASPD